MPSRNTTYADNAVIATNAGTYQITFSVLGSPEEADTITALVRSNGVAIAGGTITRRFEVSAQGLLSTTIIATLPAGAAVDIALSSQGSASWVFAPGQSSVLTLVRLA